MQEMDQDMLSTMKCKFDLNFKATQATYGFRDVSQGSFKKYVNHLWGKVGCLKRC